MSKEFKTIGDIITDKKFVSLVKVEIDRIKFERDCRPEPAAGCRYKRSWFDRMTEENIFTADFFIANIAKVWLKKSPLCAEYRNVLLSVCTLAYNQMMIYYERELINVIKKAVTPKRVKV